MTVTGPGPVVVLLVDGTTAAPVAARWAASVARDTGRGLLAVVPSPDGSDPGDAAALAGRVEPALRSAGVPLEVRTCAVPPGRPRASAAAVRAALADDDVALLVCPASCGVPARLSPVVAELVASPPADLLVVPGGALPRRHAGAEGAVP